MLLDRLPRTSWYVQAVLGERARWGDSEHLLASLVDQLAWLNHNYAQAHTKKRLPRPSLMRRPGVVLDEPGVKRYKGRARPLDELRRLKERWRKGGDVDG